MSIKHRNSFLLLCCIVIFLQGGCSSPNTPEGTIKAYWKALLNNNTSRAMSYTDGSAMMAELSAPGAWGGANWADKRLFFKHCSSTMLEMTETDAKVRWSMNMRAMMNESGETWAQYGFNPIDAGKAQKYMDAMSVVEFTLVMGGEKWIITSFDMPNLVRIANEVDLDILRRMEQIH